MCRNPILASMMSLVSAGWFIVVPEDFCAMFFLCYDLALWL